MLPDFIFENKKETTTIHNEGDKISYITEVSFNDGIYVTFKGGEFPAKVLSTPEILYSVNIIKAIVMELLRIRLNAISILSAFNRVGLKIMRQYFLKDEYRTLQTKELCNSLYHFSYSLTSDHIIASNFSKILSHLIEYDNAYRLRFIDIASEIDPIALKDNIKGELKRLLSIWLSREIQHGEGMKIKISRALSVVLWLLRIPSIKKASTYAIEKTNFDNMKYDNIDTYWAYLRKDYNFKGLSYETRMQAIKDLGYSLPLLDKR
jgi:hypothetical protein